MKQFKFFQVYPKWRNFTLWKNCMRRDHIENTKDKLNKKLLLIDPILKDPLEQLLKNY